MKVILLEDIKSLGKKNQVVEVNDGYARNFLLKNKKAVEATASNLNGVKIKLGAEEASRQRELARAKELGQKLAGKSFVIKMKTGEGGRLYGSLTSAELMQALKKEGYDIDKRDISLNSNVKHVGTTKATLRLHSEVKVEIEVKIEAL